MGEQTGIGWAGGTWNPWMGCTKIDPGCDHCYMFVEQRRYGQDPEKVRRSKTRFHAPEKWKDPRLIFTCSWSDWFHVDADPWRDDAWDVIRRTPHHTYQILTKRHGRIAKHLPPDWPLPNVWLGVSGADHDGFHRRARALAKVPGDFVRFMSAEPLVGRVQVTAAQLREYRLDWVIVGGESQPGCRPMALDWAREIRDACVEADVPLFLKQLGGHPKKRADAEAVLDGRTWTQMPKGFEVPA
jgi:protein gp37